MESNKLMTLLKILFTNTSDRIYFKDVNSVFILASKKTAEDEGFENPEDMEGKTDYDFYPKELADNFFACEQKIIRTGIPQIDLEEENYKDDLNGSKWVSTSKIPFKDENGKIIGLVGIGRDITERKKIQETLRNRDVELAHQSGKAEVASDVLHNIGNVLNSVYVSSIEMIKILSQSRLQGLIKANDLLQINRSNIVDFIQNDPKGQTLLNYYVKIGEELNAEKCRIENELSQQLKKINIIKEILDIQQNFAKSPTFFEKLVIRGIIKDSVMILQRTISKNQIIVDNNVDRALTILTNKAKLTHVIINIIKNAIEAMEHSAPFNRLLSIDAIKDDTYTHIIFSDKGEGIEKENLTQIFHHGFTTKKEGKGFGLHACANSMTELKGKIIVNSEGKGKGAVFTLIIPNHN